LDVRHPSAERQSHRGFAHLAGADADQLAHWRYPDLAVTNRAGPGVVADRLDDRFGVFVSDDQFDLDLRQEVDAELRAAPLLDDATLAPVPADVRDRDAAVAELTERREHEGRPLLAQNCLHLLPHWLLSSAHRADSLCHEKRTEATHIHQGRRREPPPSQLVRG